MDYIRQILNVSKDESPAVTQNALTFCPGIKLLDEGGIKSARAVGWFLSYDNVSKFLETEDFELDYANFASIDNRLARISMRFVKLDAERKHLALPTLDQDKSEIMKMVMTQIYGPDYETEGYFVLRMTRELPFQGTQIAHKKMTKLEKENGKMPPIYVTGGAFEKLYRITGNMLDFDKDENSSIIFETTVTKQSTALEGLGPEFENIELDLSVIEAEQSFMREDLQSIRDKTVLGLATENDIEAVVNNLDRTIEDSNALHAKIESKKQSTNETHLKVHEHVVTQSAKIESLKQEIRNQEMSLAAKTTQIRSLQTDQVVLKSEYDTQISLLEHEIQKLSETVEQQNQEKSETIPLSEARLLEEENLNLEEKKKELEKLVRSQKLKLKNYKTEVSTLTDDKSTIEQKLEGLKSEFETTQSVLAARKTENDRLRQEITDLNERCVKMSTISQRNRQLSTESESTSEILSSSFSPKRSKLVRQPKIDASEVKEWISPTVLQSPNVVAISSKDVTSVLPKYSAGHATADYVSKIKKAWEYCKAETFDEKKFCTLLMTQLPDKFDSIVDELDDAAKGKVDSICTKLMELDRQKSQYLADYARCSKSISETYQEFALRIKKLYLRGTGNQTLNSGENLAIVEAFLNGLPSSESTALRLCANENELGDVFLLAKRASRSRPNTTKTDEINELRDTINETKESLNEIRRAKTNYPDRQEMNKKRRSGKCHFCHKHGHFWRECRGRAAKNPNWRYEYKKPTDSKKDESK